MHNHSQHAHHIREFKNRFWISIILTAPILLLSEMIQSWFPALLALQIPYQKELLLFLSIIVYFYGGWPFLKGLAEEIKARQPGMMTLIGMAITVAFLYSAGTVFLPLGMDFF